MSLYCLGTVCKRSGECLRVEAYKEIIENNPDIDKMSLPECASIGIWFIFQSDCINHGYEDGVFLKKGGQQ